MLSFRSFASRSFGSARVQSQAPHVARRRTRISRLGLYACVQLGTPLPAAWYVFDPGAAGSLLSPFPRDSTPTTSDGPGYLEWLETTMVGRS